MYVLKPLHIAEAKPFYAFKAELRKLTPTNIFSKLEFYSIDSNGTRFYSIGSGDWKAYYFLEETSAVTLDLFDETATSENDIVTDLEIALQAYRSHA